VPSERLKELQAKFDRLRATIDSAQTDEGRDDAITSAQAVITEMIVLAQEGKRSHEAEMDGIQLKK
jgi:hypothetical protein